jgi:hypothetical protein
VAGLALGQSRFSPGLARFVAAIYGLFVIPWQMGISYYSSTAWSERVLSIAGRVEQVVASVIAKQVVGENIFFTLLMACLFWALGVHAGYTLTRSAHPWRTVLPTGLALLVIHTYDAVVAARSWFLAVYLFLGLLIVGRLAFARQNRQWQAHKTYVPLDVGLDFIRLTLAVAAVLVLLAWLAPVSGDVFPTAAEVRMTLMKPWKSFSERMSYAFANLKSSVGITSDYYDTDLYLGRGVTLSSSVVLRVQAPSSSAYPGVPYYWRARIYDLYEDGGWKSTAYTAKSRFDPDQPNLPTGDSGQRALATFKFLTYSPIITLYTATQPVWISRPASVDLARNGDGTVDIGAFNARTSLYAGDEYQVRALLSTVTAAQLREAGAVYPEWVAERYLQVPATVTPRTRALAQQLAQGLDNPYDIVVAVTQYLRTNMTYASPIPAPPANQEPLDWFLFTYKQGFCNYYASSEVILLRTLGIPARVAAGYAAGEQQAGDNASAPFGGGSADPNTVVYIVRQKDAHAWPEVYFPGIGWVEFEPTSAQAPIARPLGIQPAGRATPTPPMEDDFEHGGGPQEIPDTQMPSAGDVKPEAPATSAPQLALVVGALMLASGGLVLALVWRWRHPRVLPFLFAPMQKKLRRTVPVPVQFERGLRRLGLRPPGVLSRWAYYAALPALPRSYLEINRALRRLGQKPAAHATPAERAKALKKLLPEASEDLMILLKQYEEATYGPRLGNTDAARSAEIRIRWLSYKFYLQRLLRGLQEPRRPESGKIRQSAIQ